MVQDDDETLQQQEEPDTGQREREKLSITVEL